MIRSLPIAAVLLSSIAIPATAQTVSEQRRWEAAQRRYDTETAIYDRARADYEAAQRRDRRYGYNNGGYNDPRYNGPDDGRYATDYDASRYYRDDPRYQERVLSSNDQVYRGSDGRYYCKRSDGTAGLIVGGIAGGVLGNAIAPGGSKTLGTLLGAAGGAAVGSSIDKDHVRCR